MGVYLSSPIIEKVSIDKKCPKYSYGASSMQGWRMTQEDAHNCLSEFDEATNTSYFAVYDGHGGAEVAQYTSMHLPDYIKNHPLYKDGKLIEALQKAFLGFDATLTEESVVQELKTLAGVGDEDDNEMEDEEGMGRTERDMLVAEANMPIGELMAKYYAAPPGSAVIPQTKALQKEKHSSPMIRPKRSAITAKTSNSNEDKNNSSTSESDPLASRLENRLENEQPDNDNNLNVEKEMRDSQSAVKPKDTGVEPDSTNDVSDTQSNINNSNANDTDKPVVVENGETDGEKNNSSEKQVLVKSEDKMKTESIEPDSTSDKSGDKLQESCSSSSTSSEPETKVSQSGSPIALTSCPASSSTSTGVSSIPGSSTSSAAGSSSSSAASSSAAGSSSSSAAGSSGSEPSGSGVGSSSSGDGSSSCGPSGSGSSSAAGSSSGGSGSGVSDAQAGGSGVQKPAGDKKVLLDEDFESDDDSSEEEDEEYMSDSEEDEDDDEDDDEEVAGEAGGIFGVRTAATSEEDHVEEPGTDSGCTAVVVLIRESQVFVANAGDSRCVLCRDGNAVDLSFDHKPEDDSERSRIEAAGGKVTNDGRVNGGLNLSRALGDHWYKRNETKSAQEQMISALPDIESTMLGAQDQFLIIACDGIWNYMTSQETVDFVKDKLKDPEKSAKPSLICEELFDHCLAPNTMGDGTGCDNMTCIIVVFNTPSGGDSSKRDCEQLDTSSSEEKQPEKRPKLDTDEQAASGT